MHSSGMPDESNLRSLCPSNSKKCSLGMPDESKYSLQNSLNKTYSNEIEFYFNETV